jgi:two-component system C4-dicarboxylate transport response regulator DctD
LFSQLVNEAAVRYRKDIAEVPGHVLSQAAARRWPGNVRELRNAAERYVLGLETGQPDTPATSETTLATRVADFERNAIAAELTANSGNLKQTYEALGLSRKSLYEKMQKYNLSRDTFAKDI